MLKGFRDFIMRGNVVDLAVAVIIGAAFGAVVTALVTDIFTPLIAAIAGKPSFDNLTVTLNGGVIKYGSFITAVINFLLIAAAIYFAIVMPMKKLAEFQARRRAAGQPEEAAAVPSDELVTLRQIRDLLEAQQRAV
jgi:large conductance mechanosensitive channel